jgi:hypothetical protein
MLGAKLIFHCQPCCCLHGWLFQAVMLRTRCTRDQVRGCCKEMRGGGSASSILTTWHIRQRIQATAGVFSARYGTFVTQNRLRRRQELCLQNLPRDCQPQAQNRSPGLYGMHVQSRCLSKAQMQDRISLLQEGRNHNVDALVIQVCRCS